MLGDTNRCGKQTKSTQASSRVRRSGSGRAAGRVAARRGSRWFARDLAWPARAGLEILAQHHISVLTLHAALPAQTSPSVSAVSPTTRPQAHRAVPARI